MEVIIKHLEADPVVEAVYDAKSEEIGPGIFRFKAEIGAVPLPLGPSPLCWDRDWLTAHVAVCTSALISHVLCYHKPW